MKTRFLVLMLGFVGLVLAGCTSDSSGGGTASDAGGDDQRDGSGDSQIEGDVDPDARDVGTDHDAPSDDAAGDSTNPGDGGDDTSVGDDAGGDSTVGEDVDNDVQTGPCTPGGGGCGDGVFCNGAEICDPSSADADERGCLPSPGDPCAADERCSENADRCLTDCDLIPDVDRDGFARIACGGTDCNDNSPMISPGHGEVCGNGVDDDCDGDTDESECLCQAGQWVACYTGPQATSQVGVCRNGVAVCASQGVPGACQGETLPTDELCDGLDNNCDGQVDEGLQNACGGCGATPTEACGDNIDNDCDGFVDEGCECDFRCLCEANTSCTCEPPTNQPCYDGPVGTSGNGICAGGVRDCIVDPGGGGNLWEPCRGQTLPGTECSGGVANGIDDDCDGIVDEGCRDSDSDGVAWPADCDDTDPAVRPGASEVCNGRDDNCDGVADEGVTNGCGECGTPPTEDVCGNGLDDNCDGSVDEICPCPPGESQPCYSGPAGTQGVGGCAAGTQTCEGMSATTWNACTGEVLPAVEFCDGQDNDCDGEVDERWAAGSNACGFCDETEVCDGLDNDCDGIVDDGVSNACGTCGPTPIEVCNGADDDCDGLVDEGVVNACGTCPPSPCFEGEWNDPAQCVVDGRVCDDIEEHPDYPGGATLGQAILDFDYIYIAVTNLNQVVQIDTNTGAINWTASSHGGQPSRTAVTFDGSVWVGNRAYSGYNTNDPSASNVVHLSAVDGSLICRAPVLGIARSVAIDANGNIWAGSYNTGHLWHISGTVVDNSTSPPTCQVLWEGDTGVNIYGLALDPDGFVWTSSAPTVRVSVADHSMTSFTNPSFYGIAADGNRRMWFGGWSGGGNIHAIDRDPPFALLDTGVRNVTAVTVHPEGSIWGSGYGVNQIVGLESNGVERCRANIPSGTNPHGVAVDRLGRIWTPSRFGSGTVNVFDTSCNHIATYTVSAGQELYSYSDMTGHLLRTFTAPEANWSQTFDSGYASPYWTSVEWSSVEPPNTGVEISVRAADDAAGLATAPVCGPFATSAGDLTTCGALIDDHRFLQVNARLYQTGTDDRPVLQSVRVFWAY